MNTSTPVDPGPPRNLCGEMNTASSEGSPPSGTRRRVHVDLDIGGAGGEIETGHGVVAVQQRAISCTGERMPVTLEAAENDPMRRRPW